MDGVYKTNQKKGHPTSRLYSCFATDCYSEPFRQGFIHTDVVYADIAGANICPALAKLASSSMAMHSGSLAQSRTP